MTEFHSRICRQVKQLLLLLLLMVPLCAPGASRARAKPAPASTGQEKLVKAMLAGHNGERAKLKLAALQWNAQLADDARKWAENLAATNSFDHAHAELLKKKQGENLWMGTADAFGYPEMLAYWLDERANAKSGRFPDVSKTGNWADVAHYTQIVWPGTKQVGCAIAKNASDEILVCRYFPAGNIFGENVRIAGRK